MKNTNELDLDQALANALEGAGLGDYAWQPAPKCPQGHPTRQLVGSLCEQCIQAMWDNQDGYDEEFVNLSDVRYYMERFDQTLQNRTWRIGRVPKPLSTDANLLLAAVEAWVSLATYDTPREACLLFQAPNPSSRNRTGGAFARMEEYHHCGVGGIDEGRAYGERMVQTLALAFLSMLKKGEGNRAPTEEQEG